MLACGRCHILTEAVTQQGELWLCGACPVGPPCPPFQHDYGASDAEGVWVCRRCGTLLHSSPISTAVVPAELPTPAYVDC